MVNAIERRLIPVHDGLTRHTSYTILDIELDENFAPQNVLSQAGCCGDSKKQSIPLYRYEDVPNFLRGNPYIKGGYRVRLPASLCILSLFTWSNESMNIWTHIFGFVLFSVLMVLGNHGSQTNSRAYPDHLYVIIGLICFQVCMVLSSGYHLLNCHSEKACRRWLSLDLAGICIGIVGCYIPAIHLAFYCLQVWRDFYMVVVFMLGSVTLGLQMHPRFLSSAWESTRIALYCSVAGYGVIPACHWVYLEGGFSTEIVQIFYGKVIGMYSLGMLAFGFYASKFPEKIFPGKVDYIGSSHQWWHVITVVAFCYWYHAGEVILQYRLEKPCAY